MTEKLVFKKSLQYSNIQSVTAEGLLQVAIRNWVQLYNLQSNPIKNDQHKFSIAMTSSLFWDQIFQMGSNIPDSYQW